MVVSFFAAKPLLASSTGNNIYLAQNSVGAATGADCADALPASWFNNPENWGAGGAQIGAGTTVHVCGTITGAPGSSALVVQGSGASGNPITIQFESGSSLSAPYWGGASGNCNLGDLCSGAITVNGLSNIVIDGGNTGVIQNTANGTGLANGHSSAGIFLSGSNLTVQNLTIKNIYLNQGASPAATDTNGLDTADIRVEGGSSNIQINNNTLSDARAGIWSDTVGSNVNFFGNTINDHAWHISLSGSGAPNVYNNQITDWSNWQFPSNAFHTDGIIAYGDNSILTPSIYSNYIFGDLGAGSPTGFIFCTYGTQSSGSGSGCTIFNNLLVGTGYSATNDQGIYFHSGNGTNPMGPHYIYNNTFVGLLFQIYAESDPGIQYSIENNVFVGNGAQWFIQGNNSPLNVLNCNYNIYFGGRGYGPFSWGAVSNGQFTDWQGAFQDPSGLYANPNLDSNYRLTAGSPAATVGANLSPIGISALMVGQPSVVGVNASNDGVPRSPVAPNWPAGAFGPGTASVALQSATASVQKAQ